MTVTARLEWRNRDLVIHGKRFGFLFRDGGKWVAAFDFPAPDNKLLLDGFGSESEARSALLEAVKSALRGEG